MLGYKNLLAAKEGNAIFQVNKEKQNNDSKADERGEVAAGRPSNWEENRKSSFAGRRSRRNSTTEDSQLTIENFGGSQDNLNFIGRNPDKEVSVARGTNHYLYFRLSNVLDDYSCRSKDFRAQLSRGGGKRSGEVYVAGRARLFPIRLRQWL